MHEWRNKAKYFFVNAVVAIDPFRKNPKYYLEEIIHELIVSSQNFSNSSMKFIRDI
jgi:hypothetical protein